MSSDCFFEPGHHTNMNVFLRRPNHDTDYFVGVMLSPIMAQRTCAALNNWLGAWPEDDEMDAWICGLMERWGMPKVKRSGNNAKPGH